jgi:RNA polymerase sigma factor (sigma-70 family)
VGNTTIVYVEDERDYQKLVTRILWKAGYDLHLAGTGEEGFRLLDEVNPGLLLLDINLPDTDGFSICRKLRQSDAWKNLQVLMLTVRRQPNEWLKGFESGANDYVSKPLNPPELLERVEACVKAKSVTPIIGAEDAEYQLVQAALGGNRGAYDALIRQNKGTLLRNLAKEVRNNVEAEDLASWAIAQAWEHLHQFQGGAAFLTWVHQIALHEHYRRTSRWPHVSLEEFAKGEEDGWLPLALMERTEDTDTQEKEAERAQIREIISSIPRFSRKLLELHFVQGLPYEEIAERVSVPLGTLCSRMARAKMHLRREWSVLRARSHASRHTY